METDEGREYVEVFKQLRLNHLINHHMDMEMLLSGRETLITLHYGVPPHCFFFLDRIIPVSWLNPIYRCQWQALLKVDQGIDRGPQNVTDDEFEKNCLRCGRTLTFGGKGRISCIVRLHGIECVFFSFFRPATHVALDGV